MVDALVLISGVDIPIRPGVTIKQPKLSLICSPEVGQKKYDMYVSIFDVTVTDMLGGNSEALPTALTDHIHIFDWLTGIDEHRQILLEALHFFLQEEIIYSASDCSYYTASGGMINRDVFDEIAPVVLDISCVQKKRETAKSYANKRAQKIFEKINKCREQKRARGKSDPNYTISNIVSKLSSKHPSYNLLNIWDLTIYQLYDQFACMCLNNQLDVIGLRWAAWGKDDFDFSQWYKKQT